MNRYVCTNCGYRSAGDDGARAGAPCPSCGSYSVEPESSLPSGSAAPDPVPDARHLAAKDVPSAAAAAPEARRLYLSFTGTAGEYFRIWIVNTFLTVVTLGIYAAWAKVRTRRYFYRSTMLNGHPFDYTANPTTILKGHLIIAAWAVLYSLANAFNPLYSSFFLVVFYAFLPLLIYKSLRFFLHNTVYRNVRFRFLGAPLESYKTYLVVPIYLSLTLGLLFPYWAFRRKKYFFSNLAYGATRSVFSGRPGPFYREYFAVFVIGIVLSFTGIMMTFFFFPFLKDVLHDNVSPELAPLGFLAMAVVFSVILTYLQQELYAWTANYCWENTALGSLRLSGTLRGTRLFWITVSNFLAIIASLGLLIPWAKVRRLRYIYSNVTLFAQGNLDDFAAAAEAEASAVGEAATDFFDVDVGI